MKNRKVLPFAALLLIACPLGAETTTRRAMITGARGPASCTIDVNVDHSAEIEVRGDTANLTTTGGQPAYWRDFRCNAPLPDTPRDFRIARVNGRGRVTLLKEPRHNRGSAVIHIIDPQGGRGGYSIHVSWSEGNHGWGPSPPPTAPFPGGGPARDGLRNCQQAVTDRLNRDGYQYVTFGRPMPEHNPGPNNWISGFASAKRRSETRQFSFTCSVDSWSGRVRSVDVRPSHSPRPHAQFQ